MKFFVFLIFCCQSLLAQQMVSEEQLSKLLIVHMYHCDFKEKKFQRDFELGELPITIRNLQFLKKDNEIEFTGEIIDLNDNPVACNIYLAKIGDSKCKSEKFIGTAKSDGSFKVTISCNDSLSIYFTYPSYNDLELCAQNLYCR